MQLPNKPRTWITVGVLVFLVSIIANAPASLIGKGLQSAGIHAQQVSGSLWQGRASGVILKVGVETIYLDHLDWDLTIWRLLLFSLSADIAGSGDGIAIEGDVDLLGEGHWRMENTQISFPATMIGLTTMGSYAGEIDVSLESVEVDQQVVNALSGKAMWASARWFYDNRWWTLGSFTANLSNSEQGVMAEIGDTDPAGPIGLQGNILVKLAGSYDFSGNVTARDNAPRELFPLLTVIGEQNPDNSFAVSFKGRF